MGGHYGSIHIRTENRDAVLRSLENFEVNQTRKFLIAPPINGWVTVFPENNGQDDAVSKALAARLPDFTIIHCLVHDDDVFMYWLYDLGNLVDAYNSCPEYFDETNTSPRGGDARAFNFLIPAPQKIEALQKALDADRFTFELKRQDKFAEILNLPNTAYAYEYLRGGETDGVRYWRKFIHIPDLTPEISAKRAAKAKREAEFKQLQQQGLLLVDEPGKKSKIRGQFQHALWITNPATSEVLVRWNDSLIGNPSDHPWRSYSKPDWQSKSCEFPVPADAHTIAISPSGLLLAFTTRHGSELHVCRLRDRTPLTINTKQLDSSALWFSPDEKYLYTTHRYPPPMQLRRIPLDPELEETTLADSRTHFQHVAMHPNGSMAAVVDNFGILLAVDLQQMRVINEVWIEQTHSHSSMAPALREKIVADAFGKMLAEMKKHLSEAELQNHIYSVKRSNVPKDEIRLTTFNLDGQLLFCGTREGIRVLEWSQVLSTPRMAAVPVLTGVNTDPEPRQAVHPGNPPATLVYGVIHDSVRDRVLFCGIEGKIKYFDLKTKRAGDLVTLPLYFCIPELSLTADRVSLVETALQIHNDKNNPIPSRFQIWSYEALCRANKIEW
jgi:hypothetical protein